MAASREINLTPAMLSAPVESLRKHFRLAFNQDGQLRQVDDQDQITDKPFEFGVHETREENQKR